MTRNLILAAGLLFSTHASASFIDVCEFEATVEMKQSIDKLDGTVRTGDGIKRALVINIDRKLRDLGGHTQCNGYENTKHILEIDDTQEVRVGDKIAVYYKHMNSMSPDGGIYQSTTWKMIEVPSELPEVGGVNIRSAEYDAESKEIVMNVVVGGGCGEHDYALELGRCLESFPVQCDVNVRHFSNDNCRALIHQEIRFKTSDYDLNTPYYNGATLRFSQNIEVVLPLNEDH